MTKFERALYIGVITILAIALLMSEFSSCNSKNQSGVLEVRTETKWDTIKGNEIQVPVPVPFIKVVRDTIHDTIPGEIQYVRATQPEITDIEKDLSRKEIRIVNYKDTLRMDSLGYLVIREQVQGLLLDRKFSYNIYRPTINLKPPVDKPKIRFTAGIEFILPVDLKLIKPGVKLKNGAILNGSIGFIGSSLKPQYGLGYTHVF